MATEEQVKKSTSPAVFDTEAAVRLMKELRGTVATGTTKSYEWRSSQLKNLLKMVENSEKQICEALFSDLSKPEMEAFIHEIAMIKSSCKSALKKLKDWMKPEKAKTSIGTFPSSAEVVSEPLGVVLVISAWNYPLLVSVDPVIGAIAAGNAVVLKPSEISPATSSLLAKLFGEYLDNSAIKVVEGSVPETTALLEQKWDKIFYTGNGKVARVVMAAAAKHLTPVVLELGGKSPVLVDSNIDLTVTARRIVSGKWGCNNGQACVAPDYVITTKDYAPVLIHALKHQLVKFFGEDPMNSPDMSRIVNSNHFDRLKRLLDDDKVSGKIIHGGQTDKSNFKISPTILLDVPEDALIMSEEIFGPLLPIVTVEKIEDGIEFIDSRPKPLAAYLFTNTKQLKEQFVNNVSAGGVLINDVTLHLMVETIPFGGVGESGMGSYHGKFSFDAFSHKKAVLYRGFSGDAPARYPPYTPGKLRLLKALLDGSIVGIIRALLGFS
ncbi:aldehyde dehydrogenase family 3 member H1-like [Rutidosis leptorrhynchoides]|uniref:aldehyde dehydrogenase family 3 member H1-like n=1 Tax=Rutidosis leptorrhynchoides TaxID=125765 RepID=UPI003A99D1BA